MFHRNQTVGVGYGQGATVAQEEEVDMDVSQLKDKPLQPIVSPILPLWDELEEMRKSIIRAGFGAASTQTISNKSRTKKIKYGETNVNKH
jgi:hypothetical protein